MLDFVRTAQNPWDQEVLIGVAWDLMWLALVAGVVFAIGHTVWKWKFAPADEYDEDPGRRVPVRGDEKIQKYSFAARAFHWIMAAAMLVLLVTAFVPVMGLQFPWVTIHWIAGVVLTVSIVYHIFHSTIWLDFWSMWVDRVDVQNAVRMTKRFFGADSPPPKKEGKYALPNKIFHHSTSLFGLGVIVTGVLMMYRIETPIIPRDPYLFSDQAWGWVYVIHGITAVFFITMVMAHIYFAIRPEKLWMTRSMILGWITGEEYAEHHDPDRWKLPGGPEPRSPEPTGTRSPAGAEAAD